MAHEIFKGLKLPGLKKDDYRNKVDHEHGEFQWSKRGGHAGTNTIVNLAKSVGEAGWKKAATKDHSSPDGSTMGSAVVYHKGDHELKFRASYGSTAHDNYYEIDISNKAKKAAMNKNAPGVKKFPSPKDAKYEQKSFKEFKTELNESLKLQ